VTRAGVFAAKSFDGVARRDIDDGPRFLPTSSFDAARGSSRCWRTGGWLFIEDLGLRSRPGEDAANGSTLTKTCCGEDSRERGTAPRAPSIRWGWSDAGPETIGRRSCSSTSQLRGSTGRRKLLGGLSGHPQNGREERGLVPLDSAAEGAEPAGTARRMTGVDRRTEVEGAGPPVGKVRGLHRIALERRRQPSGWGPNSAGEADYRIVPPDTGSTGRYGERLTRHGVTVAPDSGAPWPASMWRANAAIGADSRPIVDVVTQHGGHWTGSSSWLAGFEKLKGSDGPRRNTALFDRVRV